TRKRTSYLIEEKLIVVKYVKKSGRNAVAKKFDLNTSMIGR
ncbi:9927_t:CDS:1, partial [Funneliformis geosporum]